MTSRVESRDNKKAMNKRYRYRISRKYPPEGLIPGASFFWYLLLPEVTSNKQFMPSWIMSLKMLCNLLVQEGKCLETVMIAGPMSSDAITLEFIRSRIAQFSNYCGLGEFLIAPAVPPLREMKRKKEMRLYEKSVLDYFDPNSKEERDIREKLGSDGWD